MESSQLYNAFNSLLAVFDNLIQMVFSLYDFAKFISLMQNESVAMRFNFKHNCAIISVPYISSISC